MQILLFLLSLVLSFSSSLAQTTTDDLLKIIQADQAQLKNITEKIEIIRKDSTQLPEKFNTLKKYQVITKDWKELYSLQVKGIDLGVDQKDADLFTGELKENFNQIRNRKDQINEDISGLFHAVSKKRSNIINQLYQEGLNSEIRFSKEFLDELFLEIKSIPLVWISLFHSKFQKVSHDLESGVKGWWNLFKEIASAFLVFLLGILFYVLFNKFSKFLDTIRDEHYKKSFRDLRSRFIAKWLGRISPILPWLWLVFYFKFSERIIAGGYFSELNILFPYVTYYAGYRIFRIFIKQLLSSYSFYKYDRSFQIDKNKLNWTSKFLSNTFFIVIVIQHTLASAGGEGFLYTWISQVFFYFLILTVFYIASKWCVEIHLVAQKTFSGSLLNFINSVLSKRLKLFTCFPILVLEVIFQSFIKFYHFLERFDFIRAVSAQYFRKKVETTTKSSQQEDLGDTSIPVEFLEAFYSTDENQFKLQKSQQDIFNSLKNNIENWKNDKSEEHIALIYGEKGVGKTFLLKKLEESVTATEKLYYHLSDRLGVKEQLNQIISDVSGKKDLVVVFIDGLQYLYLSKRNGFEYFQEFLKMTQEENLENVFWCLGINNYSWEFIEAVLNKNRYFNFIYKVDRWREEDIQHILLTKSNNSQFEISYDDVLFNTSRSSEAEEMDVEAKYFRILWEEAMGNPSVAQKIWLESLRVVGEKKLKAKIPRERKEFLIDLPDEFYFVLACIVRHESMSVKEIIDSTNLSEDVVRNSVKKCIEKGYLVKKDLIKVTVSLISQHAVYSTLRRMNFIYG